MAGFGTAIALGLTGLVAFGLASKKSPKDSLESQTTEQLFSGAMNAPTTDASYYNRVIEILEKRGALEYANRVRSRRDSLVATPKITIPTATPPVATPSTTPTVMPESFKIQIARVMRALGVDPATGKITSKPSDEAIQAATLLSAQLEEAGFKEAAEQLRVWAMAAHNYQPPTPPVVTTPKIPEWLRKKVDTALKLERNPRVLRILAAELKKLPSANDPEVANLIALLEQSAVSAEQAIANATAASQVEHVLTTTPPDFTLPTPPPVTPPVIAPPVIAPPVITPPVISPPVISPPVIPPPIVSPPITIPKSETLIAAEAMVANLKRVQRSGSVADIKLGKGKEDQSLVKRFQALTGSTSDGKAGPGTLTAAAKVGICDLPYVQYWPRSATKDKVLSYRSDLRAIASTKPSGCRSLLEASATRERGQAGIVGVMPA